MTDAESMSPLKYLLDAAASTPEAPAAKLNGKELDCRRFLDNVSRQAGFFKERGVGKGSRVSIYTDSDYEFNISLFALWGIGAVCIPINVLQPEHKLKQLEGIVTPDIGFISSDIASGYERSFVTMPLAMELNSTTARLAVPQDEDIGIIMFTSGTSGLPKAVPMTHRAIAQNAMETAGRLGITQDDRILINTPPYFTSAIIHVITMFSKGASIVVDRGFHFGSGLIDAIRLNGCTGFGGVPVHFSRMLVSLKEARPPEKLRFLMNSGDHLPPPVILELKKAMPNVDIFCVYGLTEVAGRLCMLDASLAEEKAGSVGKPIGEMKIAIRDEDGNELPPHREGEIYVTGPCLMKGYLNNPEANAKSMKSQGFATGDFGHMDADGFLFLHGRKDDIIKVGGEKVSVKLIEDSLHGCPYFDDFAIAPGFDENIGNIPILYYVPVAGRTVKRQEIMKYLKERVPQNHIPPIFNKVRKIPRTGSGKVIRSELAGE